MKINEDLTNVIVSPTEPVGSYRRKIWKQHNNNLYDGIIANPGYILNSDGTEIVNSGFFVTGFYEVEPNTTYVLSYDSSDYSNSFRIGYYTANQDFSTRLVTANSVYSFTTWSTTKYIKLSSALGVTQNIKIEKNSLTKDDEYILNNKNIYEKCQNTSLRKKYIFIGDSYNTTDTPQGGVAIVPWSSRLVQFLNLTQSDYYNSGVSGAGWINGNTFLNQLQTLENGMTDDIKKSITDIVVAGAINDMAETVDNIYTAMSSFSIYTRAKFPNAMITFCPISWGRSASSRDFLTKVYQIYNNATVFPNMRIAENAYTWYHNYELYQPDGHPNSAGSSTIAYFMANYLKGGINNVFWKYSQTIASSNNELGITGNIGTANIIMDNNIIRFSLSFNNSINISKASITTEIRLKLGEVVFKVAYPHEKTVIASGDCWIYNGSTYTNLGYLIDLEGTNLYITFTGVDNSGNITVNNPTILSLKRSLNTVLPACIC